jgi:hypothetical protein
MVRWFWPTLAAVMRRLVLRPTRVVGLLTPGPEETTGLARGRVGKALLYFARLLARPFGYLAFVLALAALSGAARVLGDADELGFFAGRLARMLWRYPEVTRPGVRMAWLVWAVLFGIALSPVDPIATPWDEVALGAVAVIVLWRRLADGPLGGR